MIPDDKRRRFGRHGPEQAKVAEQGSAPAAGYSPERHKQVLHAPVAQISSDEALRPSDEEATVSPTAAAVLGEVGDEQRGGLDTTSVHKRNQVET